MKNIICAAGFGMLILMCFGIVKMRGQVVKEGNKIILLQKELWELKDINDKLKNTYRKIITPENILLKNKELHLTLVPPEKVICIKEKQEHENVVSMKKEENKKRNVEQ